MQNLQIAGHTWNLKHGPNSNWDVFSFITAEGDITNFNADLNDFFREPSSLAIARMSPVSLTRSLQST